MTVSLSAIAGVQSMVTLFPFERRISKGFDVLRSSTPLLLSTAMCRSSRGIKFFVYGRSAGDIGCDVLCIRAYANDERAVAADREQRIRRAFVDDPQCINPAKMRDRPSDRLINRETAVKVAGDEPGTTSVSVWDVNTRPVNTSLFLNLR